MAAGRIDFRSWLLTLITWDGLLPACVVLVPIVVEMLLRNNRGAIEIVAVVLPMAGFFIRVYVGHRVISSNRCGILVRRCQFGVFFIGLFLLALMECVLVLSRLMPAGALFAAKDDQIVWAVLITLYLTFMIVAMFPGRTVPMPEH
ncbi:MAG: hypothetical protein JW888_18725 [Pirellulales bacterium]|nr:hypothetical protein [Pirellulales bacterium]